jgi:hypothetical protein
VPGRVEMGRVTAKLSGRVRRVRCERCHRLAQYLIPSYWGPKVCGRCCIDLAGVNDLIDAWPPTPWTLHDADSPPDAAQRLDTP